MRAVDQLLERAVNVGQEADVRELYVREARVDEGPRIKRYLGILTSLFGVTDTTLWTLFRDALGLDLPALDTYANGLPASFVTQGIKTTRRNAGPGTRIIAGIGVDVFEHGLDRSMTPADVEAGILAARGAKADGITISRNYGEMQHANLEAVGRTIKALPA